MFTAATLHLYDSKSARDIASYLAANLSSGDYYSERGDAVGVWGGSLVSDLGIDTAAPVAGDSPQFLALLRGEHPRTGGQLKYRAPKQGAVAGYDFVSNPDKSVSVMAMFDQRLVEAHERANSLALEEIQKNASRRLRAGSVENRFELPNQFTGNFLACSFTHDLSRSNDPQLHTHNFIFNITKDGDRYFALDQKEMCRSIRYFSNVYNSILASEIEKLGYETESVKRNGRIVTFRIKDVPLEICDIYSERSREIAAEAEIYKRERELDRALSVAERDVIARASRSAKDHLSDSEKLELAKSKVSPEQWCALETLAADSRKRRRSRMAADLPKSVDLAVSHLFERSSAVSVKEIASEVITQTFGALDFTALSEYLSVRENIERHGLIDIEAAGSVPDHERAFTTVAAIGRELNAIEHVDGTKDSRLAFSTNFKPFSTPEHLESERSGERDYSAQRALVSRVLASTDAVVNVRGKAGTGKTTMLKELVAGITEGGGSVYMLAPTHTAKDELIDEGFPARTVSSFILDSRADLYGKTLIIDEAGLLSASQGAALLERARRHGARVILVGDTRQHSSVEAGDFTRSLEVYSKIATFELSSIRRQLDPTYRRAVEALSEGRCADGLERIDKLGWMIERSDYLSAAVEELKTGNFDPSELLFVAPTNSEVDQLNDLIRAQLRSLNPEALPAGVTRVVFRQRDTTSARRARVVNYSSGDVIELTRSFNGMRKGSFHVVEELDRAPGRVLLDNGKSFAASKHSDDLRIGEFRKIETSVGDVLVSTANDKHLGLINGEALVVKEISEGGTLTAVNKKGVEKTIPADWRHLRHGYAVTSHKAQGRTVDRVVVAARRLDPSAAYVAASRGKKSCRIFTPSKDDLKGLSNGKPRPLALEVFDRGLIHDELRSKALEAERRRFEKTRAALRLERSESIRKIFEAAQTLHPEDRSRYLETTANVPRDVLEAFEKYSNEWGTPIEELVEGYLHPERSEDMSPGFD